MTDEDKNYLLGDIHPQYGKCAAMGVKDGEPYRMFVRNGIVSLIPCRFLTTGSVNNLTACEDFT